MPSSSDVTLTDMQVDGLLSELTEWDALLFALTLAPAWYFALYDQRGIVACCLWTGFLVVGTSLHFRRQRRLKKLRAAGILPPDLSRGGVFFWWTQGAGVQQVTVRQHLSRRGGRNE